MPAKPPARRYPIPALVLVALAGFLAYSNTFHAPFQFDDEAYIVNNPAIRSFRYLLSPADIMALTERSPTAVPFALRYAFMTRILGYLSFALNYKVHGLNVFGYHLVNLAIHILNGMLVLLVLRGILRSGWFATGASGEAPWPMEMIPAASSLLFVVHPIQTQAVTYVSQRFASMASCFYLLSILLYIRSREAGNALPRRGLYSAALVSAVAAMLTKEFAFTLPFLIALYEMAFCEGDARKRVRLLLPFAATLLVIPFLLFLQQSSPGSLDGTMRTITAADVSKISRADYLLSQFRVVPLYLRLLVFPAGQNVDHDLPVPRTLFEAPVFLSFLFLVSLFSAGVLLFAVAGKRRELPELRLASFGILWFFITLSVESTVIPLGELVAEYRMYLPSVGLILSVVSLASVVIRGYMTDRRTTSALLYVAFAAIAVTLSVATYRRNAVWGSEIALWEDAARKSPGKIRPLQNLGTHYYLQGRLEEARQALVNALRLDPGNYEAHNNLGLVYRKMGDYDNAVREYETALNLNPEDPMGHFNLGNLFLAQGDIPGAIREYRIALERIPDFDEAHNNLGVAYGKNGQIPEAIREFREAVRLNPGNERARANLSNILEKANASRSEK